MHICYTYIRSRSLLAIEPHRRYSFHSPHIDIFGNLFGPNRLHSFEGNSGVAHDHSLALREPVTIAIARPPKFGEAYKMTAILEPLSPSDTIFEAKMSADTIRSPVRDSIHQIAVDALQTRSVSVQHFYGALFRTSKLQPNSDFFYVLRCRPLSNIRLLRNEENRLKTEAFVLSALCGRSDLLIPRLIDYQTTRSAIGSPYLISGPFKGLLLSDVEPQLSKQSTASIKRSLGTLVRRLACVSGGTEFGSLRLSGSSSASQFSSWSKCVANMLESLLRDGEDALVSVPYDLIRDQIRRHRTSLDQVTQPKLVVLEVVNDQNILVDVRTHTVSGLLDYSTAMWGDPFMSDCFYNPSMGFVEGFGKLPNSTTDERIRQYLYIVYHSLLAIVRQCYRPSEDGNELAARRSLTSALTQLSSIPR